MVVVIESETSIMDAARAFMSGVWTSDTGQRMLWWRDRTWWCWSSNRWVPVDEDEIASAAWIWSESVSVRDGDGGTRPLKACDFFIRNVVWALKAVARCPLKTMPCWMDSRESNPARCVAFEDVVLEVLDDGSIRTYERNPVWFDNVVVPVQWTDAESAECPRWMKAVDEWGCGDPRWSDLLRRWMGYCLISDRRWARWLLMQGKSRAGKGVISGIIRAMVGGGGGWFSTGMEDLAGDFGLEGAENARVISIPEFSRGRGVERAVRILKMIIGEDEIPINAKYQKQKLARIRAAVMVSSNSMPSMPNENEGLSSKMLVLPFVRSFADKPDTGLSDKLRSELPGIARWAVEGLSRLVAENGFGDAPDFEAARDASLRFRLANNPLDAFLEARFVRSESGFVTGEILWSEWLSFCRTNAIPPSARIPRNLFMVKLEEETTWNLRRERRRMDDGSVVRVLRGLALRRTVDDLI